MSSTEKKPSARKRTTSSSTVKSAAPATKSAAPRTRATRSANPRVARSAAAPAPTHQDIERRAYELYLRDGGHGKALEHWLQAERELRRV
jgi:hypothetical protein